MMREDTGERIPGPGLLYDKNRNEPKVRRAQEAAKAGTHPESGPLGRGPCSEEGMGDFTCIFGGSIFMEFYEDALYSNIAVSSEWKGLQAG